MQQSDRTHVPTWLIYLGMLCQQKYARLNSGSINLSFAQPLLILFSVVISRDQSSSVLIHLAQFYSASDPPCIAGIFHHGYPTSLLSCPVLTEMMFSLYGIKVTAA